MGRVSGTRPLRIRKANQHAPISLGHGGGRINRGPLGAAAPIESDAVIAGLALPLTIETRWLFFAAVDASVNGVPTNRGMIHSLPFHFASLAWPWSIISLVRRSNPFPHAENSPAPFSTSALGLWRARSTRSRHCTSKGDPIDSLVYGTGSESIEGTKRPTSRSFSSRTSGPGSDSSQSTEVAIDTLSAFAAVLTPGCDEAIIDQTPTPSIQAHRGVGRRCAREKLCPAIVVAMTDACSLSAGNN